MTKNETKTRDKIIENASLVPNTVYENTNLHINADYSVNINSLLVKQKSLYGFNFLINWSTHEIKIFNVSD